YNLLIQFSQEDLSPVPGIAESWEASEDGLTWTYHLNPDATWSDGEPVTSEDVKYTYERIQEEEQGTYIDYVRQIDRIETPDDQTVVLHTKKPSVQMLSIWVPILPKHIWEEVPADESKTFKNEPAVGSGPFQAQEWRRGQFVRLVKNPNYFRGEPAVDEIVIQFYDNPDTMVQALKQGEVDFIDSIPTRLFQSLEGEPQIETLSSSDAGFTELGFNLYEPNPQVIEEFDAPETSTGHPALLDVRVRQAINWAIDEQELTDKVLLGEGQVGSTLVPPPLAKYHLELEESEVMGFDIARAQELLAEAGWEDTDGNGVVDKDGEDLELRLYVRSESTDTIKAGTFISDWLEQAGIRVDTKAVSDNTLTDDIYAADYDMFIWGWGSDPDPDFILSVLTCGQFMFWSDTFWCDEEYSRLYEEQKTQLDLNERAETIHEMQRIAYEESPYVIFFYDNALEAHRTDTFTGWTRQPEDLGPLVSSTGAIYTAENLKPVSAATPASAEEGGISPAVLIAIVVGAIAGLFVLYYVRRRESEEDRA
ncbi:MAG: ABC transporter substrate-binding protein, partial [Actinomycetota bacterium]|nr:ABC transporter substrate-binding protein [Actinomycetota bacterium]